MEGQVLRCIDLVSTCGRESPAPRKVATQHSTHDAYLELAVVSPLPLSLSLARLDALQRWSDTGLWVGEAVKQQEGELPGMQTESALQAVRHAEHQGHWAHLCQYVMAPLAGDAVELLAVV
jgi:hypothetical protein